MIQTETLLYVCSAFISPWEWNSIHFHRLTWILSSYFTHLNITTETCVELTGKKEKEKNKKKIKQIKLLIPTLFFKIWEATHTHTHTHTHTQHNNTTEMFNVKLKGNLNWRIISNVLASSVVQQLNSNQMSIRKNLSTHTYIQNTVWNGYMYYMYA